MTSRRKEQDAKLSGLTEPAPLFSADRPIRSRSQDLLGRAGFADSLAAAIKGWRGNDSLVIGLYGPWGSGKSSVKNMAVESLQDGGSGAPNIVEFNPWQWVGQDQLAEAFFQEIGLCLGRAGESKAAKNRAAKWRAYASYLRVGSVLATGARKAIFSLLVLFAVLGVGGAFLQYYRLKYAILAISFIALLAAGFFKWGGKFADALADAMTSSAEIAKKPLQEIKTELAELLANLTQSIVVLIDDVDRLSSDQIRLLFQLVKANADFPNLVYLLLFERKVVEESLGHVVPGSGRQFLEKIVQVGFDVPHIEKSRMERVLFEGLDLLLSDSDVAKRFDQTRWGNIFVPALSHYFTTLRDVHRFLGMLGVQVARFRQTGSFEVNPIDLIALEVLRVFEPDVYHHIPAAKGVLTEPTDRAFDRSAADAAARRIIDALIERAEETRRGQVREILKQLFLPAEWIFGGSRYGGDFEGEWYRNLRVCHPNLFDRYFYFAIPERDISQADLDLLLSFAGDRDKLAAKMRSLNDQGLLGILLNRLEAYKEHIDLKVAIPFVTALFDVGDELPDEPGASFLVGPDMHASRIIYWYLKQEKEPGRRAEVLKEAIGTTTGLYLPVMSISLESSKQDKKASPDALLVNDEDLLELKRLCVEKIMTAALSGRLAANRQVISILYCWRDWGSVEETRKWVAQLLGTKDGLLRFLKACVQKSVSQGLTQHVGRVHWRMNLKVVEDFVLLSDLEPKVAEISLESLDEEESRAVQAFRKALERRKQGKADDSFWHDE